MERPIGAAAHKAARRPCNCLHTSNKTRIPPSENSADIDRAAAGPVPKQFIQARSKIKYSGGCADNLEVIPDLPDRRGDYLAPSTPADPPE